MNKKLLYAGLAALLLAGCSSSSTTDSKDSADTASTGSVTEKATVTGSDDSETTAVITKTDGKVTGISIDCVTADGASKKDDDYDMTVASPIGKNWDEQVEFLENYLIENGIDSVKLDDAGYATEEDVLAGCTINLTDIMKAVDEANAK